MLRVWNCERAGRELSTSFTLYVVRSETWIGGFRGSKIVEESVGRVIAGSHQIATLNALYLWASKSFTETTREKDDFCFFFLSFFSV